MISVASAATILEYKDVEAGLSHTMSGQPGTQVRFTGFRGQYHALVPVQVVFIAVGRASVASILECKDVEAGLSHTMSGQPGTQVRFAGFRGQFHASVLVRVVC